MKRAAIAAAIALMMMGCSSAQHQVNRETKADKAKVTSATFKQRWHEGVKTYATIFR